MIDKRLYRYNQVYTCIYIPPIPGQTNTKSTTHDMVRSLRWHPNEVIQWCILWLLTYGFLSPAQPLIKYGPSCLVLDPFMIQGLLSSVAVFGIHLQQMASTKMKKHMYSMYSTNVQQIFSKDAVHLPFFGYGMVWSGTFARVPSQGAARINVFASSETFFQSAGLKLKLPKRTWQGRITKGCGEILGE